MAEAKPGVELKLDVDPAWDGPTYAALRRVAVLDFKGTGSPADHERAHRALPEALIEDALAGPWSASLRTRLGFDAPVTSAGPAPPRPPRPPRPRPPPPPPRRPGGGGAGRGPGGRVVGRALCGGGGGGGGGGPGAPR